MGEDFVLFFSSAFLGLKGFLVVIDSFSQFPGLFKIGFVDSQSEETKGRLEGMFASTSDQDPYFRVADQDNEHENYREALQRVEKQHRTKVSKVDWLLIEC